jgi:hypothetical protein
MRYFLAALDEEKSEREEYRAQSVEGGIDRRKIMDGHGSFSS